MFVKRPIRALRHDGRWSFSYSPRPRLLPPAIWMLREPFLPDNTDRASFACTTRSQQSEAALYILPFIWLSVTNSVEPSCTYKKQNVEEFSWVRFNEAMCLVPDIHAHITYRDMWPWDMNSLNFSVRKMTSTLSELMKKICQLLIVKKFTNLACFGSMGLLLDTYKRFPRHRGLAIPTCITARAWRTCRDTCSDG